MNPLISVIVIVKNGQKFIKEALESIIAQSYSPFEILVIDGRSTDQTAAIVGSFPNIRYIEQQGDGVASAYNEGMLAACGDFIGFLSHDDRWHKEKLEKQAQVLITRPEIDYVICRARFFLENPEFSPSGFRKELLQNDHVAPIMETLLARRSLFDQIGTFDLFYRCAEEVDWFLRAHDQGIRGETVQQALLDKRIHDKNHSLCFADNNKNILHILRRSIQRKRQNEILQHPKI